MFLFNYEYEKKSLLTFSSLQPQVYGHLHNAGYEEAIVI